LVRGWAFVDHPGAATMGVMAYDEGTADRVRGLLGGEAGLSETRMFGGIAFLINGNMACGVNKDALIVRLDPASQEAAMAEPGAREFDLSARPMKGWIMVDPVGYAKPAQLKKWVGRGVTVARRLPPKR
jgi:TfoX/Sxy family transcriptional regulator of competence genes